MELTLKQRNVLDYIIEYIKKNRISPTLEEIGLKLGVSKETVHNHLKELEKKGAIERTRKARSIRIVAQNLGDGEFESADDSDAGIEIIGTVTAGSPVEANIVRQRVDFISGKRNASSHFALRVRGDSMIEEHIQGGDIVLVERKSSAQNGDLVVALVDNSQTTLKKYYIENGRVRLQPANSAMKPTFPKEVEIQGVVVGLMRKY
ncbi:MAG: transcriptional repressor LexA [Planctomycetes bacterium]|nr:transcriptional repressor LexA [Planctomycetota bacterium]